MARDVVLRIRGSGGLVPAIGTSLVPTAHSVQCAISALAQMVTRRANSISTKAASRLTTFLPAARSRGPSDSHWAGNGGAWSHSGLPALACSGQLATTACAAGSPSGHRSVCLDSLAIHRDQPRVWARTASRFLGENMPHPHASPPAPQLAIYST